LDPQAACAESAPRSILNVIHSENGECAACGNLGPALILDVMLTIDADDGIES